MKTWTTAPAVQLEIDGVAISPAVAETFVAMAIRQVVLAPAHCELVFRDPSAELVQQLGTIPGRRVHAGIADAGTLFDGTIAAIELVHTAAQQRELRVRAYDALHQLRFHQPVRVVADTTFGELARRLAASCGLAIAIDDDGPAWERVMQWRETDFELLLTAAVRAGRWFGVRDGTLEVFPIAGLASTIELVMGDSLLEARFERATVERPTRYRTLGWDPATGRISDEAWGAGALEGADPADRTAANLTTADQPALQAPTAAARAEAAAAVFWGIAEGDTGLRPGIRVEIRGPAAPFSTTYALTEVVHTVDASRGYLTEMSSRLPPVRVRENGAAVAQARVVSVDDPERIGRVQASLPTFPSLETGWMRVVLPAAGPGKGFVALPDVGDDVLVLLPDGDPALAVVLGGVYGEHRPADTGVADGAVRRHTWRSSEGHTVQLDDALRRITVETATGSSLILGPTSASLIATTDLDIAAPGHKITITAAAVDFRKG